MAEWPLTQVEEWAGHSVEVVLKVYAKTLGGQDEIARRRVMKPDRKRKP